MKYVSINELCNKIKSGSTPSRKNLSFYGGNIPWVKTGELNNWYLDKTEENITEEAIEQSHVKILPPDTVLFAMYGDGNTIGNVSITKKNMACNQACCAMILKEDKCIPLYLLYSLKFYKKHIINLAIGGAQRNLNLDTIKKFKFHCHTLPNQKKIVSILSSYDKLICNNITRANILDKIAQSLYQKWFVDFNFPDCEKNNFKITKLGKIPDNWNIVQLSKLCELIKEKYVNEIHQNLPLLNMARIPRKTLLLNKIGNPGEISTSRIIFNEDDIIFGSIRPYLHKVVIAPFKGVTNTSVYVLRPINKKSKSFLSMNLFSDKTIIWANQNTTGTKMPVINWANMKKMPVVFPSENLINEFHEKIWPIIQNIKLIFKYNNKLLTTRDFLLAKLISGNLNISKLNIKINN